VTFDELERSALTDVQRAAFATGSGGIRLLEVGGALCNLARAQPQSWVLNQVIGLGCDAPANDDVLTAIEGFYRLHSARFVVRGDVDGLRERGYCEGEPWGRFVLEVGPSPHLSRGVAVEEAGDRTRAEFGHTCALASGLPRLFADWSAALVGRPGWHCFIARVDTAAVACAALFVRGELGYLGFAATLPSHRRRGAQSALLARRIDRARELGLDALLTTTGVRDARQPAASHRNILRAGFAFDGLRPNWLSP
jgi:GNAT superfamily N-acetyltransferase